jgi:hypothetical protein
MQNDLLQRGSDFCRFLFNVKSIKNIGKTLSMTMFSGGVALRILP